MITCISWAMLSLSDKMSPKLLVPNTFLKIKKTISYAEMN